MDNLAHLVLRLVPAPWLVTLKFPFTYYIDPLSPRPTHHIDASLHLVHMLDLVKIFDVCSSLITYLGQDAHQYACLSWMTLSAVNHIFYYIYYVYQFAFS